MGVNHYISTIIYTAGLDTRPICVYWLHVAIAPWFIVIGAFRSSLWFAIYCLYTSSRHLQLMRTNSRVVEPSRFTSCNTIVRQTIDFELITNIRQLLSSSVDFAQFKFNLKHVICLGPCDSDKTVYYFVSLGNINNCV